MKGEKAAPRVKWSAPYDTSRRTRTVAQKIAFLPTTNNIHRNFNFILPIIFTYLSVEIGLVPMYMDLPILRFHQLL
jgi:hypothetical protein